jgi:integrase
MGRPRSTKPWHHAKSGFWCATIDGKREYLDKDYKVACRKLKELRNKVKREEAGGKEWLDVPFAELADEYLADTKARRKSTTYVSARYRLLRALKILGTKVRVGEVRKSHLAKIEAKLTVSNSYSPTTIKDTLVIVSGVFNWAVKHDYVEVNPLTGFEKPAARARSRIIEPEEFQALLRVADANFRKVLIALRLTGCRPGEVRSLIWEWVDLPNALWVFPDHKTITRQRHPRPRIVPLPAPVFQLCENLAKSGNEPTEHVFVNQWGRPYSKDCFVQKMARLRKRAGLTTKAGEQIVMYSNRHSYATNAIGKLSDLELAELLGHTDTSMLRRYVHVSVSRLQEMQSRVQAKRVRGND